MATRVHSRKVGIHRSAAVQKGIVNDSIAWEVDPDFGSIVVSLIPGFDDELLQSRRLYERQGEAKSDDGGASRKVDRQRLWL